jgi:hypothetical protein
MNFQAATDELERAMQQREKKYGYKRGSNASFTRPKEYASISEGDFADPVGYNCPIDEAHIRGAVSYWQHLDHRRAYSDPKAREFTTERIVRAALKFGMQISYDPKDAEYVKLPESLKKQMRGYADSSKKSMLGDYQTFCAYRRIAQKAVE